MKREELIAIKQLERVHRDMPDCANRFILKDAIDQLRNIPDLHPAEGAVPDNTAEQNKRMREWFKERTGLEDTLLSVHMKQIDVMLKSVQNKPQPTAEGAEEILASLIESLGEPDNSIHDHSYEIRPLTVNGKCEWWMFHNGVGSGEPLAQWLQNFATLHARKMALENLREELIAYDKWLNRTRWGMREVLSPEKAVERYLKSKEQ